MVTIFVLQTRQSRCQSLRSHCPVWGKRRLSKAMGNSAEKVKNIVTFVPTPLVPSSLSVNCQFNDR